MSDPDDRPATDTDPAASDDPTDDPGDASSEGAGVDAPANDAATGSGTSAPGTSAPGTVGNAGTSSGSGSLSVEDLAEVLDEETVGESRKLNPKVRLYWVTSRLFATVFTSLLGGFFVQVFGGVLGFVRTPGTLPLGITRAAALTAAGLFVFFGGVVVSHALLYYRSWRYEVRTDSLYLTRGVLTRVQTVAPYVRVQHIDTRRGPVERLLGLSTLVVYTAGSRGADVTVPGLTDDRAAELQRGLKRLTIASEEEDAV